MRSTVFFARNLVDITNAKELLASRLLVDDALASIDAKAVTVG